MKTKNILSRHGIPEEVMTDNGRQFDCTAFRDFAKSWNFIHTTSSPYFPQSNGMAERAVKEAKNILSQEDPFLALLIHRSTPTSTTGKSPAQLACGRNFRTTLPCLPSTLNPELVDRETVQNRDSKAKISSKIQFDRRHGVQSLPELLPGDTVLQKLDGDKSWGNPGTVVRQCAPRSYEIQTQKGLYRRNRKHLMRTPRPVPTIPNPVPAIFHPINPKPVPPNIPRGRSQQIPGTPPAPQQSSEVAPEHASLGEQHLTNPGQPFRSGLTEASPGHHPRGPYAPSQAGGTTQFEGASRKQVPGASRASQKQDPPAPKMSRSGRTIKLPARFRNDNQN